MRAVVQRVLEAEVVVDGELVGRIGPGLLIYLGAETGDTEVDLEYLESKLAGLRIFADENGKMARAVKDVGGGILVIPQFTLFGDVRRGLRPSFDRAAPPGVAEALYETLVARLSTRGIVTATGRFRADMKVRSVVDGPVTILLDSRKTL